MFTLNETSAYRYHNSIISQTFVIIDFYVNIRLPVISASAEIFGHKLAPKEIISGSIVLWHNEMVKNSTHLNSHWIYNFVLFGCILCLFPSQSFTAEKKPASKDSKQKLVYEDEKIKLRVITRSPKQISAFYEGREFNKAAIKETTSFCFPAVIVINKTPDILWLILDDWQFLAGDIPIKRIKRDYWKQRWQAIGLSNAHQSTFGWTLMPDVRDLRADEGVGGSIPITMQSQPFTLKANFRTGRDKQGPVISVTMNNIPCPKSDDIK